MKKIYTEDIVKVATTVHNSVQKSLKKASDFKVKIFQTISHIK